MFQRQARRRLCHQRAQRLKIDAADGGVRLRPGRIQGAGEIYKDVHQPVLGLRHVVHVARRLAFGVGPALQE